MKDPVVISYTLYLILSIALTIWVAQTLYKSGLPFLKACFQNEDDAGLPESVNHLLRVGFYLVNLGFVALWLRMDAQIEGVRGIFEALAPKMGVVLLVLGAMHFFNLFLFQRIRRSAKLRERLHLPPVPPTVTESINPIQK